MTNFGSLNLNNVITDVIIQSNDNLNSLSGLENLTSVGGSFRINSNPGLIDLSGVENLTSIDGALSINNNDLLTSLTGLENIALIGGSLFVSNNDLLTSLVEFENITSLGGSLSINNNDLLTSLMELDNITSLGGGLSISNNDLLTSLTGLENITSLGGGLSIDNNDLLTSLIGLENITSLGGDLSIKNNDLLASLASLGNVASAVGSLTIMSNSVLTDLTGLENITAIIKNLNIDNNPALTSLAALTNITSINADENWYADSYIRNNDALTSLDALNNVTVIGRGLEITGNDALVSLSGLNNLVSINDHLKINANGSLVNLSGLGSLTSVGEYLQINNNTALVSLSGLDNLTSVGEYLEIDNNSALLNLTGLGSLTSIGTALRMDNNDALTGLSGLESMTNLSGLGLHYNDNLTDLTGLENITSIGGISINHNNSLTSLAGLENVTSIDNYLTIRYNSQLSICNMPSICDYLEDGGSYSIYNNAPGCDSGSEIEAACLSPCPTSFTPASQQDVDDFPINYPTCTEIQGDVDLTLSSGITNLDGLSQITSIGGRLDLGSGGTADLVNLLGLQNLTSIGGDLIIFFNENLISLEGLDNVTSIGGNVEIRDNLQLSTCEVQSICDYIENGGTVDIGDNAPGCNSQAEVQAACTICPQGDVYFANQQQIDDFQVNHPECTTIAGNVTIAGGVFAFIDNLDALSQITEIQGDLTIGENFLDIDLSGLENLSSIGGELTIANNYELSVCNLPFICDYIENGGIATINNNGPGCNSQAEIEAACMPVVICPDTFAPFSQEDVDNFPSNYPNCTTIDYIDLNFALYITNLDSLAQLTTITGNVEIGTFGPNNINDISGLQNVTSIGGYLTIAHSPLTDLSGLEGLTSVVGGVQLLRNYSLQNIAALGNIDPSTMTSLYIEENTSLSVCSLPNICTYINEGNFSSISNNAPGCNSQAEVESNCDFTTLPCPEGNVTLTTQQEVNDFAAQYPDCTEITGDLYIGSTTEILSAINDLSPLSQLTSVQGKLTIIKNGVLSNLQGLENLTTINNDVYIGSNPTLSSLANWNNLTSIGGQLVIRNNGLSDLTGFNSLTSIEGDYLNIGPDMNLTSLAGLENLTSIGGYLFIHDNTELNNLNGIDNIDYTTILDLRILDNPQLNVCDVSSVCNYLENGGTATIMNNALGCNTQAEVEASCMSVTSCQTSLLILFQEEIDNFPSNYPNCTEINHLDLSVSIDITNLDSLAQLTSITGDVEIAFTELTNLQGLHNVTNVGGNISIYWNDNLTSLDGLDNLTSIGESLGITDNPQLSTCNIESICNYIENGGTTYISGNAPGCNSQTEVEALCNGELCSGSTPNTDSLTHIFDEDLFIDGVGFANNPPVTFTDPATPADAVLSDISLELYFRLNGNSCENEIAIQITDPAGNTQPLTAYTTCDGGTGLYYINLNVPSGNTTGGVADWTVQFDDTNDQNADYEYSVRFARLNYVATTGGSGETTVNEVSEFADYDLFIDGVGFENNGTYTFADPGTPSDAVLSDISLELYFRLNGSSCENEIAIQITDPAGNAQALTAYTTCDGGTGLYYANLDVPSGNTTGSPADWVVEFDDTDDQNSDYEYSVRFGRLTYTTTHTEGGGMAVTMNESVSEFADYDLFIDGVGFANNGNYTFTDSGTPADAGLSNIALELYFRLNGASCENEIALQITDPAGNTQPLTAYTTCDGGTGLYYVNLNVPSGNTTGSVADWVVEFDDTNDQNASYEYSVRFGRLTYDAEYTECVPMLINEENTSTPQHINTSTHKHYSTTTPRHDNTLKLYPVPASQHLNIEYFSENANSTNIEILSNEGKTLMSQEEYSQEGMNTLGLDIANLPAGHYHIRMYNADDVQMQSFIKIQP